MDIFHFNINRINIKNKIERKFNMPIRKVKGGYKWGDHGKVYPDKKQAAAQAAAAFANGYKEKGSGK